MGESTVVKHRHLDGCEHDPDPTKLRFDDEDYLVCEHGYRLYGWRSVSKGDPDVDSGQGRKLRADFRLKWSEEQQGKVLGKRKLTDSHG